VKLCACGRPVNSGGSECSACWLVRVRSVSLVGATPTRTGSSDHSVEVRKQYQLERYAKARKEGIQPATTSPRSVDIALRLSDETGTAFRADHDSRKKGA
jgi:hypothetical protein